MKRLIPSAFLVIASLVAVAETAEVRIIRGGNCGQMETRTDRLDGGSSPDNAFVLLPGSPVRFLLQPMYWYNKGTVLSDDVALPTTFFGRDS